YDNLSLLHPGVNVETGLDPSLMNISGSDIHLHKTVMNLIINAMESIPARGTVTIKTENRYLEMPLKGYEVIGKGEYALLSIADTGGGISPEDLQHIFEPFYTTKKMRMSGSGLGLSVVWGVVKDHDGYIDVQSEKGKGTTFTLYFPVTGKDLPEELVAQVASRYRGNGESVLVIDDEKGQCGMATMMLSKLNYNVTAVESGEEAIEYLRSHKADLLVLDMLMEPGIDGLDTYKEIIKIHHGQKAIIASGFSETERSRETQNLGAGNFVMKPYIMATLAREVWKELHR
ncbi:MAG: ATP-binding protein, partial [Syntrophales bacterium LBB04]|nr:ATP-binding protein [Syntrophales bacterium LBB04]